MKRLIARIRAFLRRQDGVSATEYAMLLGLIVIGAFAALSQFGDHIDGIYSVIDSTMPS